MLRRGITKGKDSTSLSRSRGEGFTLALASVPVQRGVLWRTRVEEDKSSSNFELGTRMDRVNSAAIALGQSD